MINTWLPLPVMRDSIMSLSDDHLDKQRYQVLEIMEFFHSIPEDDSKLPGDYESHDLDGHPVIEMWKGYELQLVEYGLECCDEWSRRHTHGHLKGSAVYTALTAHAEWATTEDATFALPNWWGNVEFHLSHQAELRRRNLDFYENVFVDDGENRKLIWPQSDHA